MTEKTNPDCCLSRRGPAPLNPELCLTLNLVNDMKNLTSDLQQGNGRYWLNETYDFNTMTGFIRISRATLVEDERRPPAMPAFIKLLLFAMAMMAE